MSKIYDEQVDFTTAGDTNQNDPSAVQPISGAENLWVDVLNRTPENLRQRTEALRTGVEDLKYFSDYDRSLLLRADSTTFAFTFATDGCVVAMTGGPLWLIPALTPGQTSGGRGKGARMFVQSGGSWLPYTGTLGANDYTFVASSEFTGMRGYADTDSFAGDGFSLGGNRLKVVVVKDSGVAAGVITATVTETPSVLITITYGISGGDTTIDQLRTWIASDVNSQGTYGLSHMIRLETQAVSPAVAPLTDVALGVFQGGYDAEAHQVGSADLAAFFNAQDGSGVYWNRLQEGEGLALSFVQGPVERGIGIVQGGRRQSIFDLPTGRAGSAVDNTPSTNLFNTGREPEKIPGSVPIGKMIQGRFVFIDGTVVGSDAISLGESSITLSRLADTGTPSGAALVGYDGSPAWHADAAGSAHPDVPSGGVDASLDAIVSDLASETAADDGALRIGGAVITGTASALNKAMTLDAGSLSAQLSQLLNKAGNGTKPGGINDRVSEWGHVLKGYDPVTKNTSVLGTAGGQRFSGFIAPTGYMNFLGAPTHGSREEFMDIVVQPMGVAGVIAVNEPIQIGTGTDQVKFIGATIAARFPAWPAFFPTVNAYADNWPTSTSGPTTASSTNVILVYILGAVPTVNDGDGFYFLVTLANTREATLLKLDGTAPNFTDTDFSSAGLTFLNTDIKGTDAASHYRRTYHCSEGEPYHLIATPHKDSPIPWLETYWAESTVGTDAVKGSGYYATRAVWNPTEATPRNTDNILGHADKILLDGVETSTPTDATANHHHGSAYTLVTLPALDYAGSSSYLEWDGSGVGSVQLNAVPDFVSSTSAQTFFDHTTQAIAGFMVELTVTIETDASAAVAPWNLALSASPGITPSSADRRIIFQTSGYKATAALTRDDYIFTAVALVKTDSSGRFVLDVQSTTGLALPACSVSARPTAVLLGRVP